MHQIVSHLKELTGKELRFIYIANRECIKCMKKLKKKVFNKNKNISVRTV